MMSLLQKIKSRWHIALAIVAVVAFFFYQSTTSQTKSKKQTAYKVKRQTLKETLSISGKVDTDEKVTLRFQNSGRLAGMGVKEGDQVKKYQWVASLDQRELEKNLKKYLNSYLKARRAPGFRRGSV